MRHQESGKRCDNIGSRSRIDSDVLNERVPLLNLGRVSGESFRESIRPVFGDFGLTAREGRFSG